MIAMLSNAGVLIGIVVSVLVCFNVCMTAVKKVLDKYSPQGGADGVAGSLVKYSGLAIEFLSANSTALPQPAQEALNQK